MLMTTSEGSLASSPISLSAGGHDEQPWLVNNSTTAGGGAALDAAVGRNALRQHALARFHLPVQAADGHLLVAPEPERLPRCALLEAQRQDAHADQVGAMDALERLADHRAHA